MDKELEKILLEKPSVYLQVWCWLHCQTDAGGKIEFGYNDIVAKFGITKSCIQRILAVSDVFNQSGKKVDRNREGNKVIVRFLGNSMNRAIVEEVKKPMKEIDSSAEFILSKAEGRRMTKGGKPTLKEVEEYFKEKKMPELQAQKFFNHFNSTGWKVGKTKITDWSARADNWIIDLKETTLNAMGKTLKPTNGKASEKQIEQLVNDSLDDWKEFNVKGNVPDYGKSTSIFLQRVGLIKITAQEGKIYRERANTSANGTANYKENAERIFNLLALNGYFEKLKEEKTDFRKLLNEVVETYKAGMK